MIDFLIDNRNNLFDTSIKASRSMASVSILVIDLHILLHSDIQLSANKFPRTPTQCMYIYARRVPFASRSIWPGNVWEVSWLSWEAAQFAVCWFYEEEERRREEKKERERQRPEVWANVPYQWGEPQRIAGWSCPETTGQGPHDQSIFVSWVSSDIPLRRPKNSLARMTTAHFLPFSASPSHLHLTRTLTFRFVALSFVLRPLPTDFRHPPSNGCPPLRTRVARSRWLPFSFEEAGQRNGIERRAMDDHDRYG